MCVTMHMHLGGFTLDNSYPRTLVMGWGGGESFFVFLKFATMNMCYFMSFRRMKNYYRAVSLSTLSCFTYEVGLLFNCLAHGSQMRCFTKILASQI